MYQQPHLVPPMKLTVFDELPSTPTPAVPSQLSQWIVQAKAILSWSLPIRRPATRLPISRPLQAMTMTQSPLRDPGPGYRRLELSFYMPDNRLSDLPKFDRLSFTEAGEIKLPPRALIRTQSEHLVPRKISMSPALVKPASMIEQRRLESMRPDTSSVVISTARPASEHDALHSHPVSIASLPGLPPPVHVQGRSGPPSVAILTPMQEEFSPPVTSVTIDGVSLGFPKHVDKSERSTLQSQDPPSPEGAPAPVVPTTPHQPTRNFSKPAETDSPASYFHSNYHTQKRISQWLARNNSSSVDTTKSSSTSSFAEHRRKRAQFYQLSAAPPQDLILSPTLQHERTMTESTVVSNAETDMLSFEYRNPTDTSMTTVESSSPIGAAKTGSRPMRTMSRGVPDVPPSSAEVLDDVHDYIVIKEIGGPLRSPGVGVAF